MLKALIQRLRAAWRRRQRALDHVMLIPLLTPLDDEAFASAFAYHFQNDPAWYEADESEFSEADWACIRRAVSANAKKNLAKQASALL